jgi:hypothetical protein
LLNGFVHQFTARSLVGASASGWQRAPVLYWGCLGFKCSSVREMKAMKLVIYQIVLRYFGNMKTTNRQDGTIEANGCGKFADITETALQALKDLGVTHAWLTGCLRQATKQRRVLGRLLIGSPRRLRPRTAPPLP